MAKEIRLVLNVHYVCKTEMIMFSYFSPIYGVSSSLMTNLILVYLYRYSESSLSQFLRADFQCNTLKEKKFNTCTMSTKMRDKLDNRMQYQHTELLKCISDIPNLRSQPKNSILHYELVEWKPHLYKGIHVYVYHLFMTKLHVQCTNLSIGFKCKAKT